VISLLYYRHVELQIGLCQYKHNQKLKAMLLENDKEIMTLKSEENSEESVAGKERCNV
jgi:hypothetical protein